MKPREKRTTTEPGLGQVPGDPRRTSVRKRGRVDEEIAESRRRSRPTSDEAPQSGPPISAPPISAPPISAPPISGAPPSARHTRDIASAPGETQRVNTKALAEADRVE